jgi:hypothetical protein
MLTKFFGPKVHYLGDEETITMDEFGTNRFVEAAAGQDAFMSYVDLRLEGKPQLTAFVTAFGRTFCGKPEALQRAAEHFETTSQYQAAYTDGVNRLAAEKALEAKRLAAIHAKIDAPALHQVSVDNAAETARAMQAFHSPTAERARNEARNKQIYDSVNSSGSGYTFMK